jgi:hypothetical protein
MSIEHRKQTQKSQKTAAGGFCNDDREEQHEESVVKIVGMTSNSNTRQL